MALTLTPEARRELASGWPLVLAAALAIGVGTMGIGFYSLGLFVKPLQAEFGWSRAAVSGAATFQQFGIFLSAPLVGWLADRWGARPIAVASFIATPLALLMLARTGNSVAAWDALWLLVSLAGAGTTPAIWARIVSLRFDAARGLALGLMLMGTGTAAMLAPALLGPVFVASGWRTAVLVMASATLLVGLPASLLVGTADRPASGTRARGRFEANRQTLMLLLIAFLLGLIVAGLIVHLVPMLVDRGMTAADAAQVAAGVGVAVLVARLVVGYLFDRFHAPYVAALFLLSPVAAALLLWNGGPVVLAALMLGLAAGAEVDMLAYFTGRYAALANYGATYGGVLGVFCLGAGLGPLLFGKAYDALGGYNTALLGSAAVLAVVVALIATLGRYRSEA
ncbi:MFS transporter [Novosphingobium jiangmenense]|uniref:MFS transporter n=1 Tax=Novosphingobium jiangmenense TaxID=2791981 RepID=A0ABS0HAU3_9SPHN|nr:MFS transporter [Novosphingobium jiangmenense]MBF9149400.1 MFS transporter [Novosphingobium jiangmenense]